MMMIEYSIEISKMSLRREGSKCMEIIIDGRFEQSQSQHNTIQFKVLVRLVGECSEKDHSARIVTEKRSIMTRKTQRDNCTKVRR